MDENAPALEGYQETRSWLDVLESAEMCRCVLIKPETGIRELHPGRASAGERRSHGAQLGRRPGRNLEVEGPSISQGASRCRESEDAPPISAP